MGNKAKRIAVIVGYFPTISETFIVNQVNALIDSGHSVKLFSYKKGPESELHTSLRTHDLLNKVCYFNKAPVSKLTRLFVFFRFIIRHLFSINFRALLKTLNVIKLGKEALSLKLFFESQWFLISGRFDIVHVHFGPNAKRIALMKSLGVITDNAKLIVTFHGYGLIPSAIDHYKIEYQTLLKETDTFTVNSPYLKSVLLSLDPELQNIEVLPVGLDSNFFKRRLPRTSKRKFNIVFCGKLVPLKGPDIAIEILIELLKRGHEHIELKIVGAGKLRNDLIGMIKLNNLEGYVVLCGNLTQENFKDLLESTDVLLQPGVIDPVTGRAETQGLVIQEAQAMEVPVVISDVGGMKYGMVHDQTGIVVKEKNISAFADALEFLISNPDKKIEMGSKGASYVRAHFDSNFLNDRLLSIYNKD